MKKIKKTSGLCALVLGTSLFFTGCGEKPNIPSYAHFNGKAKHGAAVFNENNYAIGYWDAVKNELTTIGNFQNLPENYKTDWGKDRNGRMREFVYDSKGNHIGYLKYIDPHAEEYTRARNLVEADYYAKELAKEKYVSSIKIFIPDTTEVIPRK